MNANGSDQTNITMDPANEADPALCSDGLRVAFTSDRDGHSNIYLMNFDGTGLKRLTNTVWTESQPAWSPDCSKIVFTRGFGPRAGDIYVMNADGSGERAITKNVPGTFPWYPHRRGHLTGNSLR